MTKTQKGEMPERIYLQGVGDDATWSEHPINDDGTDAEYVRADLVEQQAAEIEELRSIVDEQQRIGSEQAEEWDRFWSAMGVDSEDITVDEAIAKWREQQAEIERLTGECAEAIKALRWIASFDGDYGRPELQSDMVRKASEALAALQPDGGEGGE